MSEVKIADDAELVVGTKQTFRLIEQGRISAVYVADDADSFVTKSILESAEKSGIDVIHVASKRELGARCGIETGAAAAGIMIPKN